MLRGRYLCLPCALGDITTKLGWFDLPEAKEAWAVGFRKALEWKGNKPPTAKIVSGLQSKGFLMGHHLTNSFVEECIADRQLRDERIEMLSKLGLDYIVMHGIPDHYDRLPNLSSDSRYNSPISVLTYLSLLREMTTLLREMSHGINRTRILLENTSITEFADRLGIGLPTYCHPRIGNWTETGKIARSCGAEPLCDIGHLAYSWNFFGRQHNYAGLSNNDFEPIGHEEKAIWNDYGFSLRRGEIPVIRKLPTFTEAVKEIDADYYHLDSSCCEASPGPDGSDRCDTHRPFSQGNEWIRGMACTIFKRPQALVTLEIEGEKTDGGGPQAWRGPTLPLQLESWKSLCLICAELAQLGLI